MQLFNCFNRHFRVAKLYAPIRKGTLYYQRYFVDSGDWSPLEEISDDVWNSEHVNHVVEHLDIDQSEFVSRHRFVVDFGSPRECQGICLGKTTAKDAQIKVFSTNVDPRGFNDYGAAFDVHWKFIEQQVFSSDPSKERNDLFVGFTPVFSRAIQVEVEMKSERGLVDSPIEFIQSGDFEPLSSGHPPSSFWSTFSSGLDNRSSVDGGQATLVANYEEYSQLQQKPLGLYGVGNATINVSFDYISRSYLSIGFPDVGHGLEVGFGQQKYLIDTVGQRVEVQFDTYNLGMPHNDGLTFTLISDQQSYQVVEIDNVSVVASDVMLHKSALLDTRHIMFLGESFESECGGHEFGYSAQDVATLSYTYSADATHVSKLGFQPRKYPLRFTNQTDQTRVHRKYFLSKLINGFCFFTLDKHDAQAAEYFPARVSSSNYSPTGVDLNTFDIDVQEA